MESAVYLLALSEQTGPFKIGLADSAAQRAGAVVGAPLDQLAGESSVAFFPSRSIAARVERLMHAVFAPHRLAAGPFARTGSSEWFARQAFDPARALLNSQATILGGRLVPFRDVLPPPKPPPKPKPKPPAFSPAARLGVGPIRRKSIRESDRWPTYGLRFFKKNPKVIPCPPWFYVILLQRMIWELRSQLIYLDADHHYVRVLLAARESHPAIERLAAVRYPMTPEGGHCFVRGENVTGLRAFGFGTLAPLRAYRWERFVSRFPAGYQPWREEWRAPLTEFFDKYRPFVDDDFSPSRDWLLIEPHWL